MKKKIIITTAILLALFGLTSCSISEEDVDRVVDKIPVAVSILSVNKTKTDGLVDTYTIQYSDGRTYDFTVTNGRDGIKGETGEKGEQGIQGETGIQGIQGVPGNDGHTPVITIDENNCWVIDGIKTNFNIRGEKGDKGEKGDTGLSAYEIFIKNNPKSTLTEDEWLDSLINNKFTPEISHEIIFNTNCGITVENQVVKHGEKIKKPAKLDKTGYTFQCWEYNNIPWNFSGYSVTEDMNLEAIWEANTYTMNFNLNGADQKIEPITIHYDDVYTFPEVTKKNYIFLGWKLNDTFVEDGTWHYLADQTFEAMWAQETYTIHYDFGYDSLKEDQICDYNKPYILKEPTRKGYTFLNWTNEENKVCVSGNYNYLYDLNLKANWKANEYTILLNSGIGNLNGDIEFKVTFDKTFNLPVATHNLATFVGWYLEDEQVTDENGSSLKPYQFDTDVQLDAKFETYISTRAELENLSKSSDNINAVLVNDIDLGGKEWTPIGTRENPYFGSLDGNGHVIKNMTITKEAKDIGLFGAVYKFSLETPTIKNIVFDNAKVKVDYFTNFDDEINCSIVCGYGYDIKISNIIINQNCSVISNQSNNPNMKPYFAALAGTLEKSSVTNCVNNATVTSNCFSSGLVSLTSGSIDNCTNNGVITGKYTAGILSTLKGDGSINSTVNNANLYGNEVSGIANQVLSFENGANFITYCTNNGNISENSKINNESYSAGIVFYGEGEIKLENCLNTGNINGVYSAGIINQGSSKGPGLQLKSCINLGDITASYSAGGIGCTNYESSTEETGYDYCFNAGTIKGKEIAGGILSTFMSQMSLPWFNNCINVGNVYTDCYTPSAIASYLDCSRVVNSYNSGLLFKMDGTQVTQHESFNVSTDNLTTILKDENNIYHIYFDVSNVDITNKKYPTIYPKAK